MPKTVNRSLPIELEREYSGSDDQKDGDDIRHQESFEFDRSDSILTRLGKASIPIINLYFHQVMHLCVFWSRMMKRSTKNILWRCWKGNEGDLPVH